MVECWLTDTWKGGTARKESTKDTKKLGESYCCLGFARFALRGGLSLLVLVCSR